MGQHYVPKAHIKRFHIHGNDNIVWMYDKKTENFVKVNPKEVAQERNYYTDEIEKSLANEVESPANKVINKLLCRESLEEEERTVLSLYMFTMATRGPRQREKLQQDAPNFLNEVVEEIRVEIAEAVELHGWNEDLRDSKLAELESTKTKFLVNPPPKYVKLMKTPFFSKNILALVHNMRWHILRAPSDMFFVTCDTPAHIFECYGVGTPKSELTFPISKEVALVGECQNNCGLSYDGVTTPQIVKEINRRVLSHAKRFVFAPKDQDWIATVTNKTDPYLSRILW